MGEQVKIPALNLEEMTSGGNDSFSYDSVTDNNTTAVSVAVGTKEKKNSIRDEDIDYKTRIKRHTEKDNEILIGDQVRREATEPPEGFVLLESIHESFFSPDAKVDEWKKSKQESHLAEESKNNGSVCLLDTSRSSPSAEPCLSESPKMKKGSNVTAFETENAILPSTEKAIAKLKKQNYQLMEALLKTQKSHDAEKKRFHEILFGLDKALSSLPIRLEKIRVRNQRNLSIINSSRFNSGDVSVNFPLVSGSDTTISEETSSSQESNCYLSIRMQCLLRKMNQLNELIHTIKQGDSSPIELLVNSELYAISLLKKEIKSTKKQIDESKTDTETVTSCPVSGKGDSTEDSASKAKNSFSNALNNASNFKIFENHMIFQEEALNLLTRKIRETEGALLKEMEANEGLKRENETMAKEIFRLKSAEEEEVKGEKFQKIEKLKAIVEETGNRPYRLIKELKAKLEEKEKTLIAWKSKYSRLESANSNKSALLENEKKKNSEMEMTIKNLKSQTKNLTAHLSSLEFVNQQLKDQCEILKAQVELLARERLDQLESKRSRIGEQVAELSDRLQDQEAKAKKAEKTVKEMKNVFEAQLAEAELRLTASQNKNEEFCSTFKELLSITYNFWLKKEGNSTRQSNYNRIREILHITPSDLDLLLNVCGSGYMKEVEELYAEFKSIITREEKFSPALSSWFFDIIRGKLLHHSSKDKSPTHSEET